MKFLIRTLAPVAFITVSLGYANAQSTEMFQPQVQPGEVLTYQSMEYVGQPVNELDRSTVQMEIGTSANGTLTFHYMQNKSERLFTRDATGELTAATGTLQTLPLVFFWPRQLFGSAPSTLAPGASWAVDVPAESIFGPAGIAHLTVTAIDAATGEMKLHLAMKAVGDAVGTPPHVNAPVHFHTLSTRVADITLVHGVVESIEISGTDVEEQSGGFSGSATVSMRGSFTLTRKQP